MRRLYLRQLRLRLHDDSVVVLHLRVLLVGQRHLWVSDAIVAALSPHRLEDVMRLIIADALNRVERVLRLGRLRASVDRHVHYVELQNLTPVRPHHNGLELLDDQHVHVEVRVLLVTRFQVAVRLLVQLKDFFAQFRHPVGPSLLLALVTLLCKHKGIVLTILCLGLDVYFFW